MLNKLITKFITLMTSMISKSVFSMIDGINEHVIKHVNTILKRIDKIEPVIKGNENNMDSLSPEVLKSLQSIDEISKSLTVLSERIKQLAPETPTQK